MIPTYILGNDEYSRDSKRLVQALIVLLLVCGFQFPTIILAHRDKNISISSSMILSERQKHQSFGPDVTIVLVPGGMGKPMVYYHQTQELLICSGEDSKEQSYPT